MCVADISYVNSAPVRVIKYLTSFKIHCRPFFSKGTNTLWGVHFTGSLYISSNLTQLLYSWKWEVESKIWLIQWTWKPHASQQHPKRWQKYLLMKQSSYTDPGQLFVESVAKTNKDSCSYRGRWPKPSVSNIRESRVKVASEMTVVYC